MNTDELARNYGDALDRFVVGYNKGIVQSSVTLNSLDVLDGSMGQVERGLDTIVSAFEEMRASSASNSENTKNIDELMAAILSKNGSMDREIALRMEELKSAAAASQNIAALFAELEEKTRNIAGMTGGIKDVSERTGILAINASIEAARAGAVGKGFRIIANEVRNLANQTGDFAKNIESNIGEFQVAVQAINAQMNEFTELLARFRASFSDVLVTFGENAKTLDTAGQSLSGITASIREEALALNDGLASLERVNDSMHETHVILDVLQRSHENLDHLLNRSSTDLNR